MTLNIDSSTVLVFDLDDTLYKEIDFLKSAYREIAQHINITEWRVTYALMFAWYREGQNVFDKLESEFDVNKAELLHLYRNHIPNIALQAETKLLFDQLKAIGATLTLLTDGRSLTQRNKIKALGLKKWMDIYFISEELGTEKPSENNFRAVEDHFRSNSYFYIADNLKKDFITPNQRGWVTIGLIDNGLNIHVHSESHKSIANRPKYFIFHLAELLES